MECDKFLCKHQQQQQRCIHISTIINKREWKIRTTIAIEKVHGIYGMKAAKAESIGEAAAVAVSGKSAVIIECMN